MVVTIASVASTGPSRGPSTTDDVAAVDLLHEHEPIARQAQLPSEPIAVGGNGFRVVADVIAEVERVVRRCGDAPLAGGDDATDAVCHGSLRRLRSGVYGSLRRLRSGVYGSLRRLRSRVTAA